jgi:hypothetical protein
MFVGCVPFVVHLACGSVIVAVAQSAAHDTVVYVVVVVAESAEKYAFVVAA